MVGEAGILLEMDDWFDRLHRTVAGAGVLFRDQREHLLLVKPTYKDGWQLPGGVLEEGESPRAAARRETEEELGLVVEVGRLLCIDYKSPSARRPGTFQFVFDGGILDPGRLERIVLAADELSEWRMVPRVEALELIVPGRPAARFRSALEALDGGSTLYLEDGELT